MGESASNPWIGWCEGCEKTVRASQTNPVLTEQDGRITQAKNVRACTRCFSRVKLFCRSCGCVQANGSRTRNMRGFNG
mgnify:CR=1 FL=1